MSLDVKNKAQDEAYVHAIVLVLLTFFHSLLKHHTDLATLEMGMQLRIACSSLIYRKVNEISYLTKTNSTVLMYPTDDKIVKLIGECRNGRSDNKPASQRHGQVRPALPVPALRLDIPDPGSSGRVPDLVHRRHGLNRRDRVHHYGHYSRSR